eukprot:6145143-Amphidinium_carterae.1
MTYGCGRTKFVPSLRSCMIPLLGYWTPKEKKRGALCASSDKGLSTLPDLSSRVTCGGSGQRLDDGI